MAQRTVYDSGQISGRGASKHVARLVAALKKQYPSKGFTVTHVKGSLAAPGKPPRPVHRIVVERKPG